MKVTLIIWISAIILQEVEPGTLVRIPRDVGNLKSSLHTEYEANYKQKGKHGNDSFSTIKGNQEILHENCNDTWNEFAEKCASLVKDLIASLANTISSSPGDATNLQLHIKNNFTHIDTSHTRNCFKRPPTCLSKLNFSSLFNNETGNILNRPNADAPISVLTTLKKPDSCEQDSPNSIQPNGEDIILNNSAEDLKRSQQGSSLHDVNGSHMNPEEAEALTGPQINNSRRQVKYPNSQVEESGNAMVIPEDSTTDALASPRLPEIPLNTNGKPHVSFDPKDMSLEISAVPSNPPFNIRNTSPSPYFTDRMGNSENSFLDQSASNENMSSEGPKGLTIAFTSSENPNEVFSNSLDRKNSFLPKYTSQEVSSEEEKYHTFLPPQSLVGEPLLGDSQQLHEEFESEEKPNGKVGGHATQEEKMPHPPTHDHHSPLPKIMDEEPPVPVIPQHPFIAPTTPSPLLMDTALPSTLPSEDSQSKEPSPPLLSADYTPHLSKTNESPHSISHQDPSQGLISNPLHPIESQPVITDEPTPQIIAPLPQPEKTPPEIIPTPISNVQPPAKEVSHDENSNGNQPPSSFESVPSSESSEPQILIIPQPSNKPLEASNHLSQKTTESAELAKELVSSEESPNYGLSDKESPDDKSSATTLLLIPAPESKKPISHFDKLPSSVENPEIVSHHHPHNIHEHLHAHHNHPHHPGSTTVADEDKSSPEITHIPNADSEEKFFSPKRELALPHTHSHPPHPKIELVPVPLLEKELPPPPPPPPHPKEELVPLPPPAHKLPPPPPPPPPKVELVPLPPPEDKLPPPPPPPPPKIELVPVPPPEKELPPPPPPPPPKVELVPVPPPAHKLPPPPPPPPTKVELVPVPPPEKELPPPPPKVELVPVPPPEKELLPPPPPPPPKVELVPVPPPAHKLPPPPPPKVELVPVPPPEKELPPPPPPKIELVPVPSPEKELPPPPKVELAPVPPPAHKLPPPPPPPPPKVELVPISPPEKELPPPPPPKIELVPVPPPEKELPPPPPPKIELVPVPSPEKELPPPPPPKIELVPVPSPEKELPPPPKIELVPVSPPEDKLPPPPPPKIELVPVPEKEFPPPPPKVELVPLPPPEDKLPPPPPKIELVPVSPPEKELPPPSPKVELVPVSPSEDKLPPPPPPPPPKIELVPVTPPEKELPPTPKIKLVPISSLEQNEIPSHDLKGEKAFADMPWSPHSPHAPHPPPHHHPHHPPPHQLHHHHPHHKFHQKEEDDDDSAPYSAEVRAPEEEKQLESERATTFQTTSADPTPPESSLSYPPFFMPNPTSQAPPPLTIPNSEAYPMMPSTTTFETVPETKPELKEDSEEDAEEDCCSCESCTDNDETGGKIHRISACQDLEQARRELKAIFDKIKKKLKCGRKTQRPTITT